MVGEAQVMNAEGYDVELKEFRSACGGQVNPMLLQELVHFRDFWGLRSIRATFVQQKCLVVACILITDKNAASVNWELCPPVHFVSSGLSYEQPQFRSHSNPAVMQNCWVTGIKSNEDRATRWGD